MILLTKPKVNVLNLIDDLTFVLIVKNHHFIQFKYITTIGQKKADANLINSRKGIYIDDEDFKKLDTIIKNGIDNDKSIYQIKIKNNDIIEKSVTTIYRYINSGYLTTKRIDLPYDVKYKKRKHKKIFYLYIFVYYNILYNHKI